MNLINKIEKLRKIDIYFAAILTASLLIVAYFEFHPEIRNTYGNIIMSIGIICGAILFSEYLTEFAANIVYVDAAMGLTMLAIWLELPPVAVISTMLITVSCAVLLWANMPKNGTFVQRITHRRKLVFSFKLVSY